MESDDRVKRKKIIRLIVGAFSLAVVPWLLFLAVFLSHRTPLAFITDTLLVLLHLIHRSGLFWWFIPFGLLAYAYGLAVKDSLNKVTLSMLFLSGTVLLYLIGGYWWGLFNMLKNPPP